MPAPLGNQFWKARSSHGRKPIFDSPEKLWEAACEYFEWVEANPISAPQIFSFQGQSWTDDLPKPRPMTVDGLQIFLDISRSCWEDYQAREDFVPVTKQIEQIIRDQKFAGASVGLFNANIIARDLGLKDQTANEHTGADGKPIAHSISISFVDAN